MLPSALIHRYTWATRCPAMQSLRDAGDALRPGQDTPESAQVLPNKTAGHAKSASVSSLHQRADSLSSSPMPPLLAQKSGSGTGSPRASLDRDSTVPSPLDLMPQLQRSGPSIVKTRNGSVLSRGFILKTDFYPSGSHSTSLREQNSYKIYSARTRP